VPLFIEQIAKGGPVTVTDPNMTRFVMSIPMAVDLVLKVAETTQGGEVFILKMPALRIGDLAEVMIEELAPRYGHAPGNISIKITGRREGEKNHEELLTEDEAVNARETEDMFVICPMVENKRGKRAIIRKYSSENTTLLTKEETRQMLMENLPYLSETTP
jgi:FlaA1/EpsC-like NDP-sugar epimerase